MLCAELKDGGEVADKVDAKQTLLWDQPNLVDQAAQDVRCLTPLLILRQRLMKLIDLQAVSFGQGWMEANGRGGRPSIAAPSLTLASSSSSSSVRIEALRIPLLMASIISRMLFSTRESSWIGTDKLSVPAQRHPSLFGGLRR